MGSLAEGGRERERDLDLLGAIFQTAREEGCCQLMIRWGGEGIIREEETTEILLLSWPGGRGMGAVWKSSSSGTFENHL